MIKKAISLALSLVMIVSVFVLYGIYGEKEVGIRETGHGIEAGHSDGEDYYGKSNILGAELIKTYDEWQEIFNQDRMCAIGYKGDNWGDKVNFQEKYSKAYFDSSALIVYGATTGSIGQVDFLGATISGNELLMSVLIMEGVLQAISNPTVIVEISKKLIAEIDTINVLEVWDISGGYDENNIFNGAELIKKAEDFDKYEYIYGMPYLKTGIVCKLPQIVGYRAIDISLNRNGNKIELIISPKKSGQNWANLIFLPINAEDLENIESVDFVFKK